MITLPNIKSNIMTSRPISKNEFREILKKYKQKAVNVVESLGGEREVQTARDF
jgi:hypothetical protein